MGASDPAVYPESSRSTVRQCAEACAIAPGTQDASRALARALDAGLGPNQNDLPPGKEIGPAEQFLWRRRILKREQIASDVISLPPGLRRLARATARDVRAIFEALGLIVIVHAAIQSGNRKMLSRLGRDLGRRALDIHTDNTLYVDQEIAHAWGENVDGISASRTRGSLAREAGRATVAAQLNCQPERVQQAFLQSSRWTVSVLESTRAMSAPCENTLFDELVRIAVSHTEATG
ncbi:MAG: hypothetical protein KDA21_03550 [Phycisphaerales bacterium]|nr:hypothetical protein [Phycisphaerales bacterium]